MRVIVTTCRSDEADALASRLVEDRLVACANLIPGVRSIFHWQGELCREDEVVVWMETSAERVEAATARLRALHSYEVPKILVLEPERCNDDYRAWLASVVGGATR
jgi:periplasmic divalent cation tolerance protein